MNIVILDNFDSFTYNLKDEFLSEENHIFIWRNNISLKEVSQKILNLSKPRLLVLSPGPSHPKDAGCMLPLIEILKGKIPIFGVCLGHQAIVVSENGIVDKAKNPMHGKSSLLEHKNEEIFKNLPNPMKIGRYHSLIAKKVPDSLKILATSQDEVMAISHKNYPMIGVQFHPESILTTLGSILIENIIAWAKEKSVC